MDSFLATIPRVLTTMYVNTKQLEIGKEIILIFGRNSPPETVENHFFKMLTTHESRQYFKQPINWSAVATVGCSRRSS